MDELQSNYTELKMPDKVYTVRIHLYKIVKNSNKPIATESRLIAASDQSEL